MSHAATISALPAECLLHIFLTLPVRDVISCGRVCKLWWQLTKTQKLWKIVELEGLHIISWEEATQCFKKWRTKTINFNDCGENDSNILPWKKLCCCLRELKSQLRCLRFQTLTTEVIECINQFVDLQGLSVRLLTTSNPYADEYPEEYMEFFDIGKMRNLQHLRELRINLNAKLICHSSFSFYGGLNAMKSFKHLRILSLTSFTKFQSYEFGFLSKLSELVEVQLGNFAALPPEAFTALAKLPHLRKLCLLNGDCGCQTKYCQCKWPDAVGNLVNLVELELAVVRIVPRLNACLRKLTKLLQLELFPVATDFIPNWKTVFSIENARKSDIFDVVDGLTHLRTLTWAVWCPYWAFTKDAQDSNLKDIVEQTCGGSATDNTGTLIVLKDMLQQHLPNTEILIIPVINKELPGQFKM